MAAPYIPPKEASLDAWALNFSTLLTASPATYGATAGDAANIAAFYATWHAAYLVTTNPATKTKPSVASKNAAKASLLANIRPLAQFIANNPGVTNANKEALGLNLHGSTGPTPIPAPSTSPILAIIAATPGQMTLRYADQNTPDKRAKAPGTAGLELHAATSATVITDPSTIPFVGVATKQPYALNWSSSDKGKTAYIAGRWVTGTGLVGPWSAIVTYIVA